MSFGIANNVKSKVRVCTPELFHRALESRVVAEVCAQIKDALEAVRRGEMSSEDFETLKGDLKKALIIFTFHATFKEGRRKNEEAIPSGLSIYDLDHIPNPEGRWAEIEPRKEELGIVLAHITPSTEGLRLVFMRPLLTGRPPLTPPEGGESQDGMMSLAEAQAWMARQLGDDKYDACVKDYARCSFAVPREYVLYQSEALFNEELRMKNEEFSSSCPQADEKDDSSLCREATILHSSFPQTFKGTPYDTIIREWFRRNGGEPEPGERNTKLHKLASHLRYITDNNEAHLLQIMPSYGLKEDEMKQLIHHACVAKFYGMPQALKKLLISPSLLLTITLTAIVSYCSSFSPTGSV